LTKPFSQPHEVPSLLAGMAAVLDGLRLFPGAAVLEFGAGTGWLSRFLTQLGCRVTLLDVSPTALAIARELYERLPVIGDRPPPQFLLFDGRRIDLPDGSIDRILCFHAVHHVPDPAGMIREFARVLGPGGIAGFAEPGPTHSKAPFSQFEMRTYQVVENDVDVHHLWRVARDSGFSSIELALFQSPPLRVSVAEFEDFLAGGETTASWVAEARLFLRNTRTFFLTKGGIAAADSRRADGLACAITATLGRHGEAFVIDAAVANAGTAIWLPSEAQWGGVSLGSHLYRADGSLAAFDFVVQPLTEPSRVIAPGETVTCRLTVPPLTPGHYVVELDCVAAQVAWFAPLGSRAVRLPLEVPES
jgi:SAM-dependent methyltransferase